MLRSDGAGFRRAHALVGAMSSGSDEDGSEESDGNEVGDEGSADGGCGAFFTSCCSVVVCRQP